MEEESNKNESQSSSRNMKSKQVIPLTLTLSMIMKTRLTDKRSIYISHNLKSLESRYAILSYS
jgi:hypothetical protein